MTPEKIGNKLTSRTLKNIHGSPWEEEIDKIFRVNWEQGGGTEVENEGIRKRGRKTQGNWMVQMCVCFK